MCTPQALPQNLPGGDETLATPLHTFLLSQTWFTSCTQNFLLREEKMILSPSQETLSQPERATVCTDKTYCHVAPQKAEKSLGSQTLLQKNDFEKNFPPPEFLSLILSLNHNQLSFKCSLWLGDTYHPDKNTVTPATLAYAPAYAIQAPGQSEIRKTDPLSMALKLQPVVWNVVLGLKKAREEPTDRAGPSLSLQHPASH